MKHLFRAFVILSILSLSSCMTAYKATENKVVTDELVGMSKEDVIEYLGAPSDIVSYQNGSILVYEGNETAFVYNHPERKIANPKLEVFCNNDGLCTSTRVGQMETVKKFSAGKTILLVLSLGLIGLI